MVAVVYQFVYCKVVNPLKVHCSNFMASEVPIIRKGIKKRNQDPVRIQTWV